MNILLETANEIAGTSSSNISTATRNALIISAVVALVLAVVIFIVTRVAVYKINKKYADKAKAEAMIQIESLRNDVGLLPFELKEFFKSKAKDLDVEALINTVYRNSYKDVLIIAQNDPFVYAALAQKTKQDVYFISQDLDLATIEKAKEQFPSEFPHSFKEYKDETIDFLVITNTEKDINELFDKYYSKLKPNGMIAAKIDLFANHEIKSLKNHLYISDIRWEISHLDSKFLFIVKSEIIENKIK